MRLTPKKRIVVTVSFAAFLLFLLLYISISSILKKSKIEQLPVENYLREEVAIVLKNEEKIEILPVKPVLFEYIEVIESCGPYFEGSCLNARSGPGKDYDAVSKLRNGVVLKVGGVVVREEKKWYKIIFDEKIRYPERIKGDMYVSADYVRVLLDEGDRDYSDKTNATSTKRIIVDRSEQILYAYEDEELFMKINISTGIELTPTPRGIFTIFKKTPSRYMQGPLPEISDKYYDLPGVPWNLYFTEQGAVIHGAYWHDKFGSPASNGCVNVPLVYAHKLYKWAEIGATVLVRD